MIARLRQECLSSTQNLGGTCPRFYLGTHRGRWLEDHEFHGIPLFVTYNTLSAYQRHGEHFPKGIATDYAIDSGAYTEISRYGDWSEAARGDALFDLATLTLGHEEHLGNVVAGYGTDVDLDVIRGWWSLRSLLGIRWLAEHGFDPAAPGCEVDVLKSRL